jgi:hypothetical protein
MIYWTPNTSETEQWTPKGGWNTGFSPSEKIKCTNLFFFFKNKKGFKESMAETMAHMVLYKQKYAGMKYSDEQEAMLEEALKPVFRN